jgi:hypothetical protein
VTRLETRAPLIASVVAIATALLASTPDLIGVFHDDGIYLLTAQALATGDGFVYASLPGAPAAIHYPPLWPLLLAAMLFVTPSFPDNVFWLKLLNPVLLGLVAAGTFTLARREFMLSIRTSFAATALAVIAVPVLILSSFLLSEPLFLALLVPGLLFAERFVREGDRRAGVAAAVLAGLVVLTRTIGIALPVAIAAHLLVARRWRDLAWFGSIVAVLCLPWQLFVWSGAAGFPPELRGSYGPYLEWVMQGMREGGAGFVGATLKRNVADLHAFFSLMAAPDPGGPVRAIAGSIAIAAVLAGAIELWRRDRGRVTLLTLAGYTVITLAWPFQVDRFLWTLWPLLAVVVVAGLRHFVARVSIARPRTARSVVAFAMLLAAGHVASAIVNAREGAARAHFRERGELGIRLARAVNREPRLKGRVIASELAPLVGLYTGGIVLPLEILRPSQHLERKRVADHREELLAIDQRFRPEAYVALVDGPYYAALASLDLPAGRRLTDISAPSSLVRILLVDDQ